MRFILAMAWRDSRASRRRLLLYSLSIVLGIAALVSIGSFTSNVRRAMDAEAKALLGADLVVTSPAPLQPALEARLRELGGEVAHEAMFSSMMTFPRGGRLRLVQVHAMDGNFPFYGALETDPPGASERLRAGDDAVLLEPTLMAQYGVSVGDPVRLGRRSFRVAGALRKVPGESPGVAMMAPRAYISAAALPSTGLLAREALARYRAMVRLPAGADPDAVARSLKERFQGERLQAETVQERKRGIGASLGHLEGFLNLAGFVALVLGGIGVASALHAHVRDKLSTVAILRCLGASAAQSFCVYLVQGLGVGVAGAFVGSCLGVAIQRLLPALAAGFLPVPIAFFVSWPDVSRGAVTGIAVSFLFSLLPLLAVRRIPPLAALRSAVAERAALAPDPLRLAAVLALCAGVAGFGVWQAGSAAVGLGFAAMLGFGFAVLYGLALLVAWAARRFVPRSMPYVVRQGTANLHRPHNRTALLVLALGLGTFLVLTMLLVRTTLLREVRGVDAAGRPNLLFFDIQDDQMDGLARVVREQGAPVSVQAAIVTMKLASVRGTPVSDLLKDGRERSAAWALRREYRSTFRGELSSSEKIVAGEFTARADPSAGPVPISLEESLAKDLRLSVGDRVDWDVQGITVHARVGSLRSVQWRRLEPNFFVVFPEGVLDSAPKTYVAAMRVSTPGQSARVQQAVVGAYPNVTAIDLALVVETLDGIFSKIAFAIEFMALFTVATGLFVLAGAVLTGRHQRIREVVLLRTLGASRAQVAAIELVEYAVLGVQSALVGALLAVLGNALLAHFVFHLSPLAPVSLVLGTVATVSVLAVATGFLAGRGIADHPPLEVIRQET